MTAVNQVFARLAAGKLGKEIVDILKTDHNDLIINRYISRSVRNAVTDVVRAQRAETQRRQGFAVAMAVADKASDPMKEDCRREIIERVWDAVDKLPGKLRDVVHRHFVQEKTCREIAEALNVPEGTVKYWLSESRRRLASRLADLQQD